MPARRRSARAPKVREAVFEDYHQIADVQVRNGLPVPPCEDWLTLWNGNPVYEAQRGEWPIGWVLENEEGHIVGSISNVPLAYSFRGRTIAAAASCCWAVDPQYRSYSMLIFDRLMQQGGADMLVSTTVSPRAEPAFRMFQWSKVPTGNWAKAAFWITDRRVFAERVLLRKTGALAMALSFPVSAALFVWEALRPNAVRTGSPTPEISLSPTFDCRFDEFWEELERQNREVLLPVRSRNALRWHFQHSLKRNRVWVLTATKNSRLVAYAIFDRLDHAVLGLKRVRFVDFQCLHGGEEALGVSLAWMLQRCCEEGIHCLEITGGWFERPGLPKIAPPYNRKLASWTYYYRSNNPELADALGKPNAWRPTSFDGDASFDLTGDVNNSLRTK